MASCYNLKPRCRVLQRPDSCLFPEVPPLRPATIPGVVKPSPLVRPFRLFQVSTRRLVLTFLAVGIVVATLGCTQPAADFQLDSNGDSSAPAEPSSAPPTGEENPPSLTAATPTPVPTNAVAANSDSAPSAPVAAPTESQAPTAAPPHIMPTTALAAVPPPPDRDLFQLAYELVLPPGHPPVPAVIGTEPANYQAGRVDDFYLVDMVGMDKYQSTFDLRHVSENAYWYVEQGLRVSQDDIERSAREFEETIYPRVTGYFGTEWKPGVDGDPRLTIVHGDIPGVGGYFSSTDSYPSAIRPHSNQREMIYISVRNVRVGSNVYFYVLAHELNHAIMWRHDASEDTWVSEGIAELSVTLAGYSSGGAFQRFLRRPHISLVHWPLDDASLGAHYAGASLFMHYLYEHYNTPDGRGLASLLTYPADNVAGVESYLAAGNYGKDFKGVLQDWVVANFLDEEEGTLGYGNLDVQVRPSRSLGAAGELQRRIAQYGTHYIELGSSLRQQPTRVRFEGQGYNRLLPTAVPDGGCWWSNSGDSITSTLTSELNLTQVDGATLGYSAWYSIEEDWDYVYLQVSTNGGQQWEILETDAMSADDPLEVAYGPGYTGESGGWIEEKVDLSQYAGQEILVRFQYVTDDALNDIGFCVGNMAVAGGGVTPGDGGWQADGFVRIHNQVVQEFMVQVIHRGEENRVLQVPLTRNTAGDWQGEILVEPYPGLERTVVAITPTAPATRELAECTLEISFADP